MRQSSSLGKLVTTREHRWVLTYAAVVMLVTSLPYLLAYAKQGPGWQFTGFVFGVEDGNSYIAKMLTGEAGAWLFRTPYSALSQGGVIAFLPYLLIGKLSASPGSHEQLVALYHLFRVAAGILAILATYDFIAIFCQSILLRRLAVILATLGGGLGWVVILLGKSQWLGSLPLEFYSPETFGFLALYGIPHLSLARATLLWGLCVYLGERSFTPSKWYFRSIKLGVIWLVAALAQPITAVVLGVVIALHFLVIAFWQVWRGRQGVHSEWTHYFYSLRMVFAAGLIVLPFILYNLFAFSQDPFLRSWTGQNKILSPHPVHYLLAYGLLIPFVFLGSRSVLRRDSWRGSLLTLWVVAMPVLAYIPFNLQRRLPDGVWVALVCLAVASMDNPVVTVPEGRQTEFQFNKIYRWRYLFLLCLPSTIFLITGGFMTAIRPTMPVFRPAAEVQAFDFLSQSASTWKIVLASYDTGNALPAWAPVRVVIGHGPESVGLASLMTKVDLFFESNTSDSSRLEFVQEQDVQYVFWGPAERKLGGWDPNQAPYLLPVYQQGEYSIYEVNQSK